MHEMSLAEGVLQLVEETARREKARQVKRVILEMGDLAAVEESALRFCFDAVARTSLAEGAVLEIVRVPGAGWCWACADTVPMGHLTDPCPRCGGYRLQATSGTEMRVKEIEINEEG